MPLSQNFIKDPFVVKELVLASSIGSNDLVVEIGPGRGIITRELISRAHEVVAVEKDLELFQRLVHNFQDTKNLKLINRDFLTWNLPQTLYKVFSNIPFNITAEIIDKFLKSKNKPTDIYIIVQTEVAEKFIGGETETQSSILAKIFYDIKILGDIDRTAFTPKPQVKISFIKFTLKSQETIDQEAYQQFRDFVIYGFNQWKPNIFEIYKKIFSYDQFRKINHQLKINSLKPTQLNYSQWLGLFDIYQKFVPENKKRLIAGFEKYHLSHIKTQK